MKEFSRMAGQLGFEHNILEGFWSKWTMEQRKKWWTTLGTQGVSIWFWKHSKELRTPEARKNFLRCCMSWEEQGPDRLLRP